MPELPSPIPELDPTALQLVRDLRQGDSLSIALEALECYLRDSPQPYASAPLFLPALAQAFERAGDDFEFDEPERLVRVLSLLGPRVGRLARHPRPEVRQAAAVAVARMGSVAAAAGPDMILLLSDPDPGVRAKACKALGVACPTPDTIRRLVPLLDDPSEEVVRGAILGLGETGPQGAEAIPSLVRFLDRERNHDNGFCLNTLGALQNLPLEDDLLAYLQPLLKLDWGTLCTQDLMSLCELGALCNVLGKLGPAARAFAADLERLLRVDDEAIPPSQKMDIALALMQIAPGHPLARQTLERFAAAEDEDRRYSLLWSLASSPFLLQVQLLDLLKKLTADPVPRVRAEALQLLGQPPSRWFQTLFGFTEENAADLARQITFDPAQAVVTDVTPEGTWYLQCIPIRAVKGDVFDVNFAWNKTRNGVLKLVTPIPGGEGHSS
jgi:HEAT repeat protein